VNQSADIEPRSDAAREFFPMLPVPLLAFMAGVLGRLPALGGYWIRDDWRLLGRAAGIDDPSAGAARFVSRILYWDLLQPLFGMATDPWTWTRMLLHGGAAALVARLAGRCGLSATGSLLAGLFYAASPLAFGPVYWASGIQELLGAFLALAAIERLLAGGGRNLALALIAGALAVFSKESALGLPLIFVAAALAGGRSERPLRLTAAAILAVLSGFAIYFVLGEFAHGPGDTFTLTTPGGIPANLGIYGVWLANPWPVPILEPGPIAAAFGIAFWAAWLVVAWRRWRRGDRIQAAVLGCSLLALAPALVLERHLEPYLALTAAAGLSLALAVLIAGSIPGGKREARPLTALALTVIFLAAAFLGTIHRIDRRDDRGRPADPMVLESAVSWQAAQTLYGIPEGPWNRVVLLQSPGLPLVGSGSSAAEILPGIPGLPRPTLLYRSLGGNYGPALLAADRWGILWSTTLTDKAIDSLVLQDGGPGFHVWGPLPQALVYQCITDVGLGRHRQARIELMSAMKVSGVRLPFIFDPGQTAVPIELVAANAEDFLAYLDAAAEDPVTAAALRETAQEMFAACGADR